MELAELGHSWNELAKANPFWAILTGNQQWELDQFFLSGDLEIAKVMRYVEQLGLRLRRQRALDFGCGVGRLTQALCVHFFRCDGVDIAPSMIEQAREFNRFGQRCQYRAIDSAEMRLYSEPTFDFIYSNIVLQHIPPAEAKNYIREFVRVLNPGGVAVFQVPSGPTPPGHGALPPNAYRAKITTRHWWLWMSAGSTATVNVTVRNVSDCDWPSGMDNPDHPPVIIGNHWLDRGGSVVCNDDGRAVLPHDLKPNQHVTVPLHVRAPAIPGPYFLEFDAVQEMITWFKLKGSRPARLRVRVSPSKNGRAEPSENIAAIPYGNEQALAIHAVPKDEVIEAVESAGGKVLDVAKDGCAGPEWRSARYCIGKEPVAG